MQLSVRRFMARFAVALPAGLVSGAVVGADVNYDEAKVPAYTLPDPLVAANGRPIRTADEWTGQRRAEILRLFSAHVYGQMPPMPESMNFEVVDSDASPAPPSGRRKIVLARFGNHADAPRVHIDMVLPRTAKRPLPVFVGLHLFDRKAAEIIPGKLLADEVTEEARRDPAVAKLLAELPGERIFETILERGYAIATLDAAEIAPDDPKHYRERVMRLYTSHDASGRPADECAAIGTWAWMLSRALDYFETDSEIDARRVIAIGHSRMGKTALWAGACDERFALVVSNNSGCGGAALSKRRFGETVRMINDRFPHWFCEAFRGYSDREEQLPVDQHMLIALLAPRPVYIASAVEDGWADPRGEFLAAVGADPVYRLLGRPGLGDVAPCGSGTSSASRPTNGTRELPPLNQPMGESIGYHVRSGKHALSDYDWLRYLDFADRHLGR